MRVYALVCLIERINVSLYCRYSNRSPQIIPACRTVLNVRLALKALNLFAALRLTTRMERLRTITIYLTFSNVYVNRMCSNND